MSYLKQLNDLSKQAESVMEEYFLDKAPKLPKNIRQLIAKVAPWLTLIVVILNVPIILSLLGLSFFAPLMPFAMAANVGYGLFWILDLVYIILVWAISIKALPLLFKFKRQGWQLLFLNMLISIAYYLVTFDLISLVLGTLIGGYILFQIRSEYK